MTIHPWRLVRVDDIALDAVVEGQTDPGPLRLGKRRWRHNRYSFMGYTSFMGSPSPGPPCGPSSTPNRTAPCPSAYGVGSSGLRGTSGLPRAFRAKTMRSATC